MKVSMLKLEPNPNPNPNPKPNWKVSMLKLEANIAATYRTTFEAASRDMLDVADQKVAPKETQEVLHRAAQNIDRIVRKLEAKKPSDASYYPELKEEIVMAKKVITEVIESAIESDECINGDTPIARKIRYSCPSQVNTAEGYESAIDALFAPQVKLYRS